MQEEQYTIDTSFDNKFVGLMEKYLPKIEEVAKKISATPKYQFQELTKKLFPIYGSKIFQLPYRTFYSDYKLEMAHKKTQQFCKDTVKENRLKYLVSCMQKMPY